MYFCQSRSSFASPTSTPSCFRCKPYPFLSLSLSLSLSVSLSLRLSVSMSLFLSPSLPLQHTTRSTTTLSSKVNVTNAINFRALCCASWVTLRSNFRAKETIEVRRTAADYKCVFK